MKIDVSKLTRFFCKIGRGLKNASPEIAIVGGTIGLIASGVIACRETPKAMQAFEEHKKKMDIVKNMEEKGETPDGEPYTKDTALHDKALLMTQDGLAVAKSYAPAIILATLSVISIFAGGKIFRKRITTITGAYALLENRFGKYRNAVIDKFGADIDKELRYKMSNAIVEEKEIDENGNEKTVAKEVKTTKYDGHSDYARIFDESNLNWVKDGARNLTFLQAREQWANDKLRTKGYLFLNDVYDLLDMEHSPEGQLVGWIYDPSNSMIDSYVSFGISDIYRSRDALENVMRDRERSFLLDFNCDGRIIDHFTKYEKI